jgi:hypothetical protein
MGFCTGEAGGHLVRLQGSQLLLLHELHDGLLQRLAHNDLQQRLDLMAECEVHSEQGCGE